MSDHTAEVLNEVAAERERQVELGWTEEHDDRLGGVHRLVGLARTQVGKPDKVNEEGYYSRERLVQATALLVAAIERYDRIPPEERR